MMKRALVLSAALVAALALQPRVVAAVTPVCGNGPCQSAATPVPGAPIISQTNLDIATNPSNPRSFSWVETTTVGDTLMFVNVQQNGLTGGCPATVTNWTLYQDVNESGVNGCISVYTRTATGNSTDNPSIATSGASSDLMSFLVEFSGAHTLYGWSVATGPGQVCTMSGLTTTGSSQVFSLADQLAPFGTLTPPISPVDMTAQYPFLGGFGGRDAGLLTKQILGVQTVVSVGQIAGGNTTIYCPIWAAI